MMGTEIFKIDASWAEILMKMRVQIILAPTVDNMKENQDKLENINCQSTKSSRHKSPRIRPIVSTYHVYYHNLITQ